LRGRSRLVLPQPKPHPLQGDFYGEPARRHGCYDGVVYIGHLVEGEDGEEVEVFEVVPCRRCSDSRWAPVEYGKLMSDRAGVSFH
jgi:hypothetical protein